MTYRVGDIVILSGMSFRTVWVTGDFVDVAYPKSAIPGRCYEHLANKAKMVVSDITSGDAIFTFESKTLSAMLGKSLEKCSCGGDSIGASKHAYYCSKFIDL